MATKFFHELAVGDRLKGEVMLPGYTHRQPLVLALVNYRTGLLHFTDGSTARVTDPTIPIEMYT